MCEINDYFKPFWIKTNIKEKKHPGLQIKKNHTKK